MTIKLVSGLPGSGKSLRGIFYIRKGLADERPVYVDGIDGLQEFGWEPCNANEWQDLPDGALVVIDEAQKRWGTRTRTDVPPYIAALSEHRHRGFDFVLLTQHPAMLDSYVRRLVNGHEHLVRQYGAQVSRIFTWQECFDDPQSQGARQRATESVWKFPKEIFPLYQSATLHTVKAKIPKRLLALPLLLVVGAVLAYFAVKTVTKLAGGAPGAKTDTAQIVPISTPVSAIATGPARTPEEYISRLIPRVAGMPWSAPIFDERKVKAEPEILCVDSEKGCRCYTEQITLIDTPIMQCLQIAKHGVYNPYREPMGKKGEADRTETSRTDRPGSHGFALGSDEGRGLKASAELPTDAPATWPRPDFSYQVPFPGSGRR